MRFAPLGHLAGEDLDRLAYSIEATLELLGYQRRCVAGHDMGLGLYVRIFGEVSVTALLQSHDVGAALHPNRRLQIGCVPRRARPCDNRDLPPDVSFGPATACGGCGLREVRSGKCDYCGARS